jgi:hypothetical protein
MKNKKNNTKQGDGMNTEEKQILKNLEKTKSPMEFVLFMEENNPENFSWTFKEKFDLEELHDQVIVDYKLKNGRY